MKIGYARVSSVDQDLSIQISQLEAAGCEHVYREKQSGKDTKRPQLQRLLGNIRPRDVILVAKLDRLARSTADLLALVRQITGLEAALVSLAEPWADTSSPAGTLIVTVMAGIAQFEHSRLIERCNEGRAAAKARGQSLGRKFTLTRLQQSKALEMLDAGQHPKEVSRIFNVDVSTIYRLRRRARELGGLEKLRMIS